MPDAVIVSTARTPIGRAVRGAFNLTHGAALAGRNLPGLLVGALTGEKLAQPRRRERGTFTRIVLENPAPL